MSKRRRSSTIIDPRDDDEPLSPTPSAHNKRRKKTAAAPDPGDIVHDLYEIIRNYKKADGKVLCESFIRAPKRRSEPEYYNVVSNAIDMLRIQSKIKTDEYESVEQLTTDIQLLVNNTKAYYKKTSQEYHDACDLWDLYLGRKKEMADEVGEDDASEVAESTDVQSDEEDEDEDELEEGEIKEPLPLVSRRPTFKLPQEEMIPLTVDVQSPEIKSAEAKSLSSSGSQTSTHSSNHVSNTTTFTNLPAKIEEYTLDNPNDPLEQLFTAVMAQKGSDGRVISLLFQKLPSRAQFPGYYDVIDQPIDLKAIAKKLKATGYPDLNELENDLLLMVKNAKKFNEPGSQVHKDAMTLKKTISSKKAELLSSLKNPNLRSDATTTGDKPKVCLSPREWHNTFASFLESSKNQKAETSSSTSNPSTSSMTSSTDKQSQSAITAAASISSDEDEDDPSPPVMEYEDDESGNESFLSDSNDTLHLLYDAVASAKDSLGHLICEPFMRLPSKRVYPDYYEEIERPIALGKIKQKLKARKFESLDELAAELDLLFRNAKQYNEAKSKLYKDADHLQRLMLIKKKDLDRAEIKPEAHAIEDDCVEKKKRGRKSGGGAATTTMDTGLEGSEDKSRKECKGSHKALMLNLVNTLVQYKDKSNRLPIAIFIEKPSKKLYPDYYHVITEPIDMRTIEANVRNDKYQSFESLITDLELMFNNARHYNEETSQVYQDANFLEKMMKDKCRELNIPMPDTPWSITRKTSTTLKLTSILTTGTPTSSAVTEAQGSIAVKSGSTPRASTTPRANTTPSSTKKPSQKKIPVPPSPSKINNPLYQKLQEMFDAIVKHVDANGRELSAPFIVLPHKNEYPEYYQVIKKPIDMQKIQLRMQMKQYESLDEMVNDFLLMFDNACKFNEPDSLIYKDALTLQRVLLQTKTELMGDESSGVPDVQSLVREILTNLFVSLANYQDEEGRCFSDSLAEVPFDKESMNGETTEGQKKPLDLDTVRRYLDRGCYRRLDCFQDHIFEVLERARTLTRTDSQVYEDAVEMQRFFIKIRDEICKNGEILLSPALSYTQRHLMNALEKQKKEKLPKEMKEDAEKHEEEVKHQLAEGDGEAGKDLADMQQNNIGSDDGLVVHGQTYRVGDYVYVEPSDKTLKPHIVCIEKLWKDPDGECWLHGNWYLRPNETFHLATRKFLEKEVFKSDYYNKVKMSQHVISKCLVMFVKDYFKNKPENFDEEHVFVCESRYSAKAKAFKKIKIWSVPPGSAKIVLREEPLSKVRVESVFADGKVPRPPIMENADEHWSVFDKEREDVEAEVPNGEESCVYYEQLNFNHYVYKLGDCVYLRSDQDQPFIARIDKMWKDSNGDPWFHGPWFVRPSEIDHPPTRMFYKNEVFLSSIEDTNPMRSICGKCAVLAYKDYIVSRPTEFSEEHVCVAESSYKEAERSIRKIKALKRYQVSNKVIDDEIYFLKKPITPIKEPSPLLRQQEEVVGEDEESMVTTMMDKEDTIETASKKTDDDAESSSIASTPARTKTHKPRHASGFILYASEVRAEVKQSNPNMSFGDVSRLIGSDPKPRHASGYILFASEVRAAVKQQNPEMSFGEISRLIGSDWRNLPPDEKLQYEERAQAIAAEKALEKSLESASSSPAPAPKGPAAGTIQVFECGWDGCDYQYEEQEDLLQHVTDSSGHLQPRETANGENEYPCKWKGCARNRKNQPFPMLSRLIRHSKEVHVKGAPAIKHYFPNQLGRNYFSKYAMQNGGQPDAQGGNGTVMGIVGPPTPVGMVHQQIIPSLNHSMMNPIMGSPALNIGHPMMASTAVSLGNPALMGNPTTMTMQNNPAAMRIPSMNMMNQSMNMMMPGMSMGGMQDMQGYGPAAGSSPGMHPSMHQQYQPYSHQQQAGQPQHPGMPPYQPQQMPPPASQMQPAYHQQYSMQPPQSYQQSHMPGAVGQYPNHNMGMHPLQGVYGGRGQPHGMSPSPHMMSSPHVPPSHAQMPYGSTYPLPAIAHSPYSQVGQGGQNSAPMQPAQPPPPLFVPPPPKTQRLLHSEAYIRYIEGLNSENTSVSNWSHSLSVKESDVQLDTQQESRLPGHWLANGPGPNGNLTKSLWKLRDMMLHDSLRIAKSHEVDVEPESNPEQATILLE